MNPKTLRVFVYDWLLARGAPPSSAVIAAHFGTSVDDTRALLGELKIGKTIYPHACSGEIWMAGAFSAVPTPYRVTGSRAAWWANCAWDMLGVAVIANEPVRIETSCTDCTEPMVLRADPKHGTSDSGVVHFLVPARHWYDDLGFT